MVNKRLQDLLGAKSPLSAIYANGYGPDAPIILGASQVPECSLRLLKT